MNAEKRIRGVAELLNVLRDTYAVGAPVWYRGHARSGWKLLPSLARHATGIAAEGALIKRFMQSASFFIEQRPNTEWEWLFFMQHFGAPTRLLDWSESPLIALYFAVEGHPRADGCVWCLDPVLLNELANIKPEFAADIPACSVQSVLDAYLPSSVANERTSKLLPAAALAERRFARLAAQLGVFTITHREQQRLDTIGKGDHIRKLIIPAERKETIRRELAILKITRLTLFPELQSVAENAREVLR